MRYLQQVFKDRKQWLEWRHRGIGSSDASIIAGVSRFKTVKQLLIEKSIQVADEDQSNTYIKERGNRIEAIVRELLEQSYNIPLPAGNYESVRFPFLRASLDGINDKQGMMTEIKLLSSQSPEKFNKNTDGYKKFIQVKEAGLVPSEYWPQVQHQLFITGLDTCLFAGYCEMRGQPPGKENLATVLVKRDPDYIKKLVEQECEFWYDLDQLSYKEELE
jgi:putative phage-type endonuclease